MSQYQRLLLIADSDLPHSAASQRAVALAEATGASLHVLGLVEPPAQHNLREDRVNEQAIADHLEHYRHWLAEAAGALREKGVNVTHEAILAEVPISDLLDYVNELKPDLIIKDTHTESALKRVFVTPFDCQLMQASPVPVHLVNHGKKALPNVILAAVDTSGPEQKMLEFNHAIIRAAEALALQCDAQLHLLYAYDMSPAFITEPPAAADWVEELRSVLQEPFTELADFYGVAADHRHFVMGAPVAIISDLVGELAVDVVVMGVVQPKGINKLIGDTTERTLNLAPCSVLAVKPTSS